MNTLGFKTHDANLYSMGTSAFSSWQNGGNSCQSNLMLICNRNVRCRPKRLTKITAKQTSSLSPTVRYVRCIRIVLVVDLNERQCPRHLNDTISSCPSPILTRCQHRPIILLHKSTRSSDDLPLQFLPCQNALLYQPVMLHTACDRRSSVSSALFSIMLMLMPNLFCDFLFS